MNQSTLPTGGRKFVMSYSCGKDSTLALHKMVAAGNVPVALIVMVNKNMDRSFFHGADRAMLNRYSEALDIPMIEAETDGMDYHIKMEAALKESIAMGADLACFGDIDIEGNRLWSEERCKNAGIRGRISSLAHRQRKQCQRVAVIGLQMLDQVHKQYPPTQVNSRQNNG